MAFLHVNRVTQNISPNYWDFANIKNTGSRKMNFQDDNEINVTAGKSGDTVEISDEVRNRQHALSARAQVGELTIADNPTINVLKVNRSVFDLQQAQFSAIDRFTGQKIGSSYDKWTGSGFAHPDTSNMSNDNRMKTLKQSFDSEAASFNPLVEQATNDRKTLQKDISALLKKSGVNLGASDNLHFKVKGDGTISVISADKGVNKERVEEILNSDQGLAQKILKNSAMMKAQNSYSNDLSGSGVEMALVDVYLKEKLGYGLKDVKVDGFSAFGFDANLDSLLANDPVLQDQIARFHDKENVFEATWRFGNDTLANQSHSADSLLPRQVLGTFAEDLFGSGTKATGYEFSITKEGLTKGVNVLGNNLADDEKHNGMTLLQSALSQINNGEISTLRQAADAAISEHMVKNGGKEDDLQAIITIKNGKWSIRVESLTGDSATASKNTAIAKT